MNSPNANFIRFEGSLYPRKDDQDDQEDQDDQDDQDD